MSEITIALVTIFILLGVVVFVAYKWGGSVAYEDDLEDDLAQTHKIIKEALDAKDKRRKAIDEYRADKLSSELQKHYID